MSSYQNFNDKTDKEKFLEKQDNTFTEINIDKNEQIEIERENINNHLRISANFYENSRNENYGLGIAAISTFFGACGSIYTKIIQRTYPQDFRTVQFLLLRSFTIFFFANFHSYIKKEEIMKLKDIPEKMWFFLRTSANFFGVASITIALWYLRVSTTIIIQNLHPLFVLLMSIFILKEKFYIRYIFGLIICFLGVLITVLNESKVKVNDIIEFTSKERNIGFFFCGIDLFFISSVKVANKIMVNKKVPISTQMYYVSISTMAYSSIYTIFFGGLCFKGGFLLMCLIHGVFFYLSNITMNLALQYCPLSKVILVQYLNIVYIFILSFIFLHEKIFFTDLLGASFIAGFLLYNSYYPLSKQ